MYAPKPSSRDKLTSYRASAACPSEFRQSFAASCSREVLMNQQHPVPRRAAHGFLFLLLSSGALLSGQSSPADPAASKSKMAEQAFKNIQVLKGIPADELIPAMQFITYSLGVECSYCHVENAFEKDDKKPKQTARKMMQMMTAIDRDNFDAKQMVTCYSCHRGAPKPIATPIVAEARIRPALQNVPSEGAAAVPANVAPVEQIVAKYTDAVGGARALATINSRELKGTISLG